MIYENGVKKRTARAARNNDVYSVGIENGQILYRADGDIIYFAQPKPSPIPCAWAWRSSMAHLTELVEIQTPRIPSQPSAKTMLPPIVLRPHSV
ncbi:MAG: hypothetical protein JST84_05855 [Acidobacteria bacterium]|nr:hypothetical protein [Acidobacteriota bacterium]